MVIYSMLLIITAVGIWFLLFTQDRYGVLLTVSDSWIEYKDVKQEWLFTAFAWGIAIPMAFIAADTEATDWNYLYITGVLGFGTLGSAGAFHKKLTGIVHMTGAGIIYVGMLTAVWLVHALTTGVWWHGIWYPIIAITFHLITWAIKLKNQVYWSEIFGFIIILIGILINKIIL